MDTSNLDPPQDCDDCKYSGVYMLRDKSRGATSLFCLPHFQEFCAKITYKLLKLNNYKVIKPDGTEDTFDEKT